jgi:hypothetical protein
MSNNAGISLINASNTVEQANYKKTALATWTRVRKIEKLSFYSACQNENCKCNGWKNPVNEQQMTKNNEPICKTCSHIQSMFFIKIKFSFE